MSTDTTIKPERQILYWRLMDQLFSDKPADNLENMGKDIVNTVDLPDIILSSKYTIDTLVQRYPELEDSFLSLGNTSEESELYNNELIRGALYSKLILNLFGSIKHGTVSASQYDQWTKDRHWFHKIFSSDNELFDDINEELKNMEGDIIKRMHLREVLADNSLASKLTPSMSLVEQLLRDKSNLESTALKNAKKLIQRYIQEVAEVLKTQVAQAATGKIDHSVPPKRVYRNLDLKKTIWKNLTNWNPKEKKLYVDQLFYNHNAKKITPSRLIVVVDQSGSMVDSMVNCTILASIFAGLPKVDPHLIAYDTEAIDLTDWVHDPFEVLMRTQLGGGTDGTVAAELVHPKIVDPQNSVVVWISDFYEWKEQEIYNHFKTLKESGVTFIPVGSVNSSNYQSVNPWFKDRFKMMGNPIISGKIDKLIFELKKQLV